MPLHLEAPLMAPDNVTFFFLSSSLGDSGKEQGKENERFVGEHGRNRVRIL